MTDERRIPRRQIDVSPTLYVGGARVGDEHVDGAQFVDRVRDERGRRLRVGKIGRDDGDSPPLFTGVGRGFFCVVGVAPVGQAQIGALVGEPARDRLADAARRAGQQRYPARQVTGHGWTRMRIGLPSWLLQLLDAHRDVLEGDDVTDRA